MYYVAYLSRFDVNIVVPVEWVYQNDEQWAKFVNMGLNANQKHRIFYTENQTAWYATSRLQVMSPILISYPMHSPTKDAMKAN